MKLNFSGDETVLNPTRADIERAITLLFVEKWEEVGLPMPEESFVTLMRDESSNWIEATRREKNRYEVNFYDVQSAKHFQCYIGSLQAVEFFVGFLRGENVLLQSDLWREHRQYDGRTRRVARGEIDEEAEEQLEEDSCITIADIVECAMDIDQHHPDMAALLNAEPWDEETRKSMPDEPVPTREENMGWLRAAIGEEALNRLQKFASKWENFSPRQIKAARHEWAGDMRSLGRWARDYELWRTDIKLEASYIEQRLAFRAVLHTIRELELAEPPTKFLDLQ